MLTIQCTQQGLWGVGGGGAEREVVHQFFEPLVSGGLFNFQLPTGVVHSVFDMEIVFSKL